jgi:membrane-bound inhibitor of C-type lysozyme
MKTLSALLLLSAALAVASMPASAQSSVQEKPPAAKQAQKKEPAKKKPAKKDAAADEDDKEPDVSASSSTEFNCEHGNKLTIYRNAEDDKHIALRWNKRLLRLTRVATTTGANRFENGKNGWVWIDIPAKGMLLDSKKGRQLANECKSPEQATTKS